LVLLALLILFEGRNSAAGATTYYVDSQSGDDGRSGVTGEQAWKSLEHVNTQVFQPGDQLLFKAGSRFSGQLRPQGSGKLEGDKPVLITIGNMAKGRSRALMARGNFSTHCCPQRGVWEVSDLEITNLGTNREPWRTGVRIVTDNFGKMRHIRLRNLLVP